MILFTMRSPQQKYVGRKIAKEKARREGKVRNEKRSVRELADVFKALGNHYRVRILIAIFENPFITLDQINERVGGEFANISVHTKKLESVGFVKKRYVKRYVQHYLSEDGKYFTKFLIQNLSLSRKK